MEIGQVYASPLVMPGDGHARPVSRSNDESASLPVARKTGKQIPRMVHNQEAVVGGLQQKQDSSPKPTDLGERIKEMTERFNTYLKESKLDLHFYLHKGVGRLALQVIQDSTGKVLREYPPREWLDLEAKLKDMIGVFVDVDNA